MKSGLSSIIQPSGERQAGRLQEPVHGLEPRRARPKFVEIAER